MPSSIPAWHAVADLYRAYITGLILTAVTRRRADDAAELVFRIFRRQQLEKFLPGLRLGIKDRTREAFADFLAQVGVAQGDDTTWARDAWNELWVGALSIHDRQARLHVDRRPGAGGTAIVWRIAR
jgi:hypothetical protein